MSDSESPTRSSRSPVYANSGSENEADTALERIFQDDAFNGRILPLIFSNLTVIELLLLQKVCKRFLSCISVAMADYIDTLHLGQFWATLGNSETLPKLERLIARFRHLKSINFSYCSNLTVSSFLTLINALHDSCPSSSILSLNLFYCYQLKDEIIPILLQRFPHLQRLNLGRCNSLSEAAIGRLGDLRWLQELILVHNPNIGSEFTMNFDDEKKFPALVRLNVTYCPKLSQTQMDELKNTRKELKKELIVIGPNAPIRHYGHHGHGHDHDRHRHHHREKHGKKDHRERDRGGDDSDG